MASSGSGDFRKQEKRNHVSGHFLSAVESESDLGCVLIAGSYVDQLIADILKATYRHAMSADVPSDQVKVRIDNAMRGTSCTSICLALGFIDFRLYCSIHELREIRNHAAHFVGIPQLNNDSVHTLWSGLSNDLKGRAQDAMTGYGGADTARRRFIYAAEAIQDALFSAFISRASLGIHFETEPQT